MVVLPNLEESWHYAKNVLECASYYSDLRGFHKLRNQWEHNKRDLLQLFGDDGRIQVDMPLKLSKEMLHSLIVETMNIFRGLGLDIPEVISSISGQEFQSNKITNNPPHQDKTEYIGMKLSKFLTRYVPKDKVDEFNVKFSMVIQKAKQVGTLIVSVNPLDLLLISHNGISSCHRLGANETKNGLGEYRGGTLSYLVDSYTAVSFLTNGHMKQIIINYRDCGFEHPWKLWRQLCYIDINNKSALFMRQYMNAHEDAHKLARETIAHAMREFFGEPEMGWTVRYPKEDDDLSDYIHIHTDLPYVDSPESLIRLKHFTANYPNISLNFLPYCPACGYDYISDSGELTCPDCVNDIICHTCQERYHQDSLIEGPDNNLYCQECFADCFEFCYACNEVLDKDELYYFDGNYYCPDCIDTVSYSCSHCGERVSEVLELSDGSCVCDECSWHTDQCEECGSHEWNCDLNYIEGKTLCNYCYGKLTRYCNECRDICLEVNMIELDNDYYCSDCFAKLTENCSECGEVLLRENMLKHEGKYYCRDCYNSFIEELDEPNYLSPTLTTCFKETV